MATDAITHILEGDIYCNRLILLHPGHHLGLVPGRLTASRGLLAPEGGRGLRVHAAQPAERRLFLHQGGADLRDDGGAPRVHACGRALQVRTQTSACK